MDPRSFDRLARALVAPKSRRGLLGTIAALGAGLIGGHQADAQVTQAQCGNKVCASKPAVCTNGCVCCAYPNGNSRCRPPQDCAAPGFVVPPPTTTTTTTAAPCTENGAGCASNAACCSGICQAGRCVATVAGTCGADSGTNCDGIGNTAGDGCGGACSCFEDPSGGRFCGVDTGSFCSQSVTCPEGYLLTAADRSCCDSGVGRCAPLCPPGGGSSCFTGETLVAMADGTTRPIADVRVGDHVLGRTGANRVEAIERHPLAGKRLYALNGGPAFVTAEHPFLTEAGWKAVDPAAATAGRADLGVARLEVGDRILALVGAAVPVAAGGAAPAVEPRFAAVALASLIGLPDDPARTVYNLRLGGDHTYVANDLVVHNK